MTIADSARQIRAGQLKPSELVERCFRKIDGLEPQIRAWVCLDRARALATAQQLDAELAAGKCRGPLHGIPIGVKDIVDVQGLPTRAGSPLTSEKPVVKDAAVVARLRDAGAVILGKTVTTEYACFDPPPTRNPWNLQHTPGGSSSGSAAAVAAGMCLAAIGTQTGGSITRPASYCGVCGFKPTIGKISLDGVVPFSEPLDHMGPIAGCVADLKLMFDAMSGSAGDARSTDMPPRIGLLAAYFMDEADQEVVAKTRIALARLQTAGAMVTEVGVPESFRDVHANHRVLMAVGAADVHREQFTAQSGKYGREISILIREGLGIDQAAYRQALEHQQRFRAEMAQCFGNCDVLVTPATPTAAPTAETTGNPKFNSPWSHSGLPTVSLPCALSQNGLPLCLQLIGPRGSEDRLLSIAAWVETQLGFQDRPAING